MEAEKMANIIKPHKKLLTKQWLILLTLSFFILTAAALLQLLLPLDKSVHATDLAIILWPITLGIIAFGWILFVPVMILWVKNLKYILEDDRIIIHKGILSKIQQNIPYRAITDFVLHRSLYDRFLGIASIRIQTAGQTQTPTGYEGNLAGLIEWDELHQNLRKKVKTLHPVSSESLGVAEKIESVSEREILKQILEELKAIRKTVEK
jgi:uncharacterized membrane protein YdbT with pleckstrin-like domain